MKITLFLAASSAIALASCGRESQSKSLTYQNIVILSDMSSRLNNRPQKDTTEIYRIVEYFNSECVKPGEKIGDKSSISFSAFTEKTASAIDINQIKSLGDKQSFINSTGKYANSGLSQKINEFKLAVKSVYDTVRNPGLDLISIFIEKIQNEPIIKQNTYFTDGVDTTFVNYDNHVYIFTDGYLEYGNRDINSQFYFGISEIEKVRKHCLENKVNIAAAINLDKSIGLPAYINNNNKYITLHVFETDERDKDHRLQTYKHPVGLRDNEILEAVWRKWSIDSGFRNLEWKKY